MCSSGRTLAPHLLQTQPRDDALTLCYSSPHQVRQEDLRLQAVFLYCSAQKSGEPEGSPFVLLKFIF